MRGARNEPELLRFTRRGKQSLRVFDRCVFIDGTTNHQDRQRNEPMRSTGLRSDGEIPSRGPSCTKSRGESAAPSRPSRIRNRFSTAESMDGYTAYRTAAWRCSCCAASTVAAPPRDVPITPIGSPGNVCVNLRTAATTSSRSRYPKVMASPGLSPVAWKSINTVEYPAGCRNSARSVIDRRFDRTPGSKRMTPLCVSTRDNHA